MQKLRDEKLAVESRLEERLQKYNKLADTVSWLHIHLNFYSFILSQLYSSIIKFVLRNDKWMNFISILWLSHRVNNKFSDWAPCAGTFINWFIEIYQVLLQKTINRRRIDLSRKPNPNFPIRILLNKAFWWCIKFYVNWTGFSSYLSKVSAPKLWFSGNWYNLLKWQQGTHFESSLIYDGSTYGAF